MGVFLGNEGSVEIRREAEGQALVTELSPDDVNVDRRRFSVEFAEGALIVGDQITIATRDGSPLKLVAGHVDDDGEYYPDWRGYVFIDDAGGIRLYDSFELSLRGNRFAALELVQPDSDVGIAIQTADKTFNCLGQISEYELTTSRDTINTDVLGEEFRNYYEAGMISGQGSLSCLWSHAAYCGQDSSDGEFPSYLARLILRLKQGAGFEARFYIYKGDGNTTAVWYECMCIVTNVALNVEPSQIVSTQIQFVATGPIVLHQGQPVAYLLQEDNALILQEDGSGLLLQDED